MVTSGWLVAPGLTGDVWRYVSSTCGGQCVMTFGVLLMPVLLADSWDIQALVSSDSLSHFSPSVYQYLSRAFHGLA